MKFVRILLALLWCGAVASAESPKPTIEIHAWVGIPADQTSVARYKELAECGFTTSFSGFPDAKSMAAALDAAQAAGVKLFVSTPQLQSDPERTVRQFKDHPALAGYHLRDEPSATDFADLARWARRIQAVDSRHPCYINLFPNYATAEQLGCPTYQEHVDRFVKEVPVPFISFDHYPIVGKAVRGEWYRNLEIIRSAANGAHKPFWAFALSVAHGPYPVPTAAHLRLQAFSDLAYGAQCIQYFTYWTPVDAHWNFREGPIDPKGNRTPTYAVVQAMNREIQALAPVFAGSQVVKVGHTGQIPAGTQAYAPEAPVTALATTGTGAVVSHLVHDQRHYLVVVNRDLEKSTKLSVRFDPARRVLALDKSLREQPLENAAAEREIGPGDMALFTWSEAHAARPQVGLWYTAWWTKDDRYHHWANCTRLPAGGTYGAGDPAVIARHYAQFRDLGVDFLVMDDTNGVGNDGGRIAANIKAWFDFMDGRPAGERIPICIGGGGEMRDGGKAAQQKAADYYAAHYASRPSYFRLEGKPLLLVDTDKNYGPGDFDDSRFTVRWAYNGDNHAAMKRRQTWGWGSYVPAPLLEECMSIWPGHRFAPKVAGEGKDVLEDPRQGGDRYARELLRVLKANPRFVTIADWNNFEEETAIEDCFSWEDREGYAVPDLYRRITRAYSRLRSEQLVKGECYRSEDQKDVFLFDGAQLIYQGGMPKRCTVIVTPAGLLEKIRSRLSKGTAAARP